MIFQRRKKIIFLFAGIFFIVLGLFLIRFKFNSENLASVIQPQQKTKIFVDESKRNEIDKILDSKNLDFQFSDKEEASSIILSKNESRKLKTIDQAEEFYIPVTSFFNRIENLESDRIKKVFRGEIKNWKALGGEDSEIKMVVLETPEVKSAIKDYFDIGTNNFEKVDNINDLVDKFSKDKKYISLVPMDKLSPVLNSVSVNNISPIKSRDFSGYPYKVRYILQAREKKNSGETKIAEAIKEYMTKFKEEKIEIIALGDIMLSRHVGTKIRESRDNASPFRKLSSLLSSADITFANLESPFFDQGPLIKEGMVFKAEPETIEGLKLAGIDIVSLANNHFGNQGRKGMAYTFSHLKNNGISYFGAGNNYSEAHTPAVIESKGKKFAFLSYNEISPESYKASEDTAGLSWISENEEDLGAMAEDIKKAKEKNNMVVVSFHWGTEYTPNPSRKQKDIAKRAIDAGADIILAQHPHVVQGIQFIDNKFVAYSLGNFVFDQMWSEETREGLVIKVYFKGDKVLSVDFIPIKIENFNQPHLASKEESKKILDRVFSASR